MTQKRCGICGKSTRKGCSKGNVTVGIHDHCFKVWQAFNRLKTFVEVLFV